MTKGENLKFRFRNWTSDFGEPWSGEKSAFINRDVKRRKLKFLNLQINAKLFGFLFGRRLYFKIVCAFESFARIHSTSTVLN